MQPSRRALALGAVATAALAASPRPARALGGDTFSVTGKGGPFIKQVANRNFAAAASGQGSMGLADANAGQYQAARLRMPQTEARVARLMGSIDAKWPYAKGRPLQVHILGVDYYNAYSLPDGSIVVAFGLLDGAKSDDEVAFVLAHELGHVRLGHFAKTVAPQEQAAPSQMGQLFLTAAASTAVGGAVAQAGATNEFLNFLTTVMVEPGHTREQEDEADCIGYDLSQQAGYSADSASARVFDTVQADQVRRKALTDSLGDQLKKQLSEAINPRTAAAFITGGVGNMRQSLMTGAARLAFGVAASRANQPQPQHRPPAERKKGIALYSTQAYPDGAPLRDEQRGFLTSVRGTGEYAQAKVAVEAVHDAKKFRADGNYPQAGGALARAGGTSFHSAPLVLNEGGRLRGDMGDVDGGERLFMQAHASQDQTVDGYVDHAQMLFKAKRNDRAMQICQQGVQRFGGDQKPFIALMIGISKQAGREDEAQRYYAQCQSYNDDGLKQDCQLAAGGKNAPATSKSGPTAPSIPSVPFHFPHFP